MRVSQSTHTYRGNTIDALSGHVAYPVCYFFSLKFSSVPHDHDITIPMNLGMIIAKYITFMILINKI